MFALYHQCGVPTLRPCEYIDVPHSINSASRICTDDRARSPADSMIVRTVSWNSVPFLLFTPPIHCRIRTDVNDFSFIVPAYVELTVKLKAPWTNPAP